PLLSPLPLHAALPILRQAGAARTRLHRGFAIGRGPAGAQTAVAARPKMQGALALFLEDEFVIDEAALAMAPFRRFVLVDPGPDGIDSRHFGAVRLLDSEKHLTPVRVKSVP